MRKISVCILSGLLIFSSCKKDDSKDTTPAADDSFKYIINYVSDMSYYNNGTVGNAFMPLQVMYVQGTQEKVSLSLSGLPAGATGDFSTAAGIPTFNSQVNLYFDAGVKSGTYPVRITSTSASTGTKNYDFNLKVTNANDCVAGLLGNYSVHDSCSNNYTSVISSAPSYPNEIYISNFDNISGFNVTGTVSCQNNYISIYGSYNNASGYYYVNGSGTISGSTLVLNYQLQTDMGYSYCTATFTK